MTSLCSSGSEWEHRFRRILAVAAAVAPAGYPPPWVKTIFTAVRTPPALRRVQVLSRDSLKWSGRRCAD